MVAVDDVVSVAVDTGFVAVVDASVEDAVDVEVISDVEVTDVETVEGTEVDEDVVIVEVAVVSDNDESEFEVWEESVEVEISVESPVGLRVISLIGGESVLVVTNVEDTSESV